MVLLQEPSSMSDAASNRTGSIRDLRQMRRRSEIPASSRLAMSSSDVAAGSASDTGTDDLDSVLSAESSSTTTSARRIYKLPRPGSLPVLSAARSDTPRRQAEYSNAEDSPSAGEWSAQDSGTEADARHSTSTRGSAAGRRRQSMLSSDSSSITSSTSGAWSESQIRAMGSRPAADQVVPRSHLAKQLEAQSHFIRALAECKYVLLNVHRVQDPADRRGAATRILRVLRRLGTVDLDAQYILGCTLEYGVVGCGPDVLRQSSSAAFAAYLSAAKRGHTESMFKIATMYELAHGTSASQPKALHYLRNAAIKNHPGAMHRLGLCMIHGELGQPQRLRDGVMWLRMACRYATRQYPGALLDYAELHLAGLSSIVLRDEKFAMDLLARGAELDHVECTFRLAEACEKGIHGLQRDPARAFQGYHRAASLGHPIAMFEIAGWYLTGADAHSSGFHVAQSDTEAFEWIARAARAGFPKAVFGLAYFYEKGIGVQVDEDTAIDLYRRAADLGEQSAVDKIAELVAQGRVAAPTVLKQPRAGAKSRNKARPPAAAAEAAKNTGTGTQIDASAAKPTARSSARGVPPSVTAAAGPAADPKQKQPVSASQSGGAGGGEAAPPAHTSSHRSVETGRPSDSGIGSAPDLATASVRNSSSSSSAGRCASTSGGDGGATGEAAATSRPSVASSAAASVAASAHATACGDEADADADESRDVKADETEVGVADDAVEAPSLVIGRTILTISTAAQVLSAEQPESASLIAPVDAQVDAQVDADADTTRAPSLDKHDKMHALPTPSSTTKSKHADPPRRRKLRRKAHGEGEASCGGCCTIQ
ncbi:Chitin synthase 4 [Polyrhizophydium stewartii]|uniref:Chitin synthase 4 n=1 Tax=Polyrhizophydium stewartii TaxID=2732419 RepID=A0ABR4N2P8_9FUNG|nr:hypothetical protein HK105_006974 [Polyrhizophydium stewartii]